MECLVPWNGLALERWEVALDEDKNSLLAQTPHWRVSKGTCGDVNVVFYSCRSTPLKLELWSVALETLQQFIAAHPHPNFVQFLGVVTPSEQVQNDALPPSECVVMEHLPISLYDVLHRDYIALSRREIAVISIQILRGLLFLHRKQQSLGVCLTSKKVMMGGSNNVKLRRFGLELVLRSGNAPAQLSTATLKTSYEITPDPQQAAKVTTGCDSNSSPHSLSPSPSRSPATVRTNGSSDVGFTTITQDLFAFGVLLLEMCAGDKPTSELFNRISCAKQIDPVFYSVLELSGVIATEKRRQISVPVTTEGLLAMLVANEQQRAVEEQRLSSSSFSCFLYADRYFVTREAEQVEIKVRERERRGEIDLKRLAAVEKELLEEQKNFAILVLQLEQSQREKAQALKNNQRLQAQVQTSEQIKRESDEEIGRLVAKAEEQTEQLVALQASLDEEHRKVETLQLGKISDAEEKQGLLFEILKLKEDKRKLATEKEEIEAANAVIARKVGREKETLEDLEGRLAQAIHRWEEEQHVRRRAERQAESTSRQLLQMEEERCKYSRVLQQSPTGKRGPEASLSYVLTLKDKEIKELSRKLQEALDDQTALQADVDQLEAGQNCINVEMEKLLSQRDETQNEFLSMRSQLEEKEGVVAGLHEKLHAADREIESLKNRIADFEEELERQAKKKEDEEKARKLRQCLTPQCDAPRYLVGVSGYCKECEERTGRTSSTRDVKQQRHRRHRSWDDASIGGGAVRKNIKNIPIMKLVHVLSGGGSEDSRVEDPDEQQLLGALKQLTSMLKSDEGLKDDLPECLVIKSVLTLMHQQKSSLVLQLECCRCLSVVVFNHDRNRLIVVAEGGVDPVLAAMKNFHSEPKMQETSCVLLTNLAHNCETNRNRILDAGGVDAVLQAMQTFPEHYGVQKRCCWALLTLAGSDLMCDSIAMRGGLGAIIAAMLNCPADEHVQYYGSWALVNLLSGTERLLAFARREGVREVAEAAHACFPGHEGIQEKTLEILRLLG
ncbi:serine/threonine protein kinase [Phytophthora nicotianae P1976]|uniref:Serine/threonine protein kinase n=1 Tax=Phytophthora nicotianae P1976 TaxID=1317066 RepID=A0A081AIB5_PHYNI|nr:serine/threonine protein kinase [Phytophthora nicotianae P1976]